MTEKGKISKGVKKWIYLPLSLLLLLALLLSIFIHRSSTRPESTFATESKEADANRPPTDANQQSEQDREEPNDKKPPRPEHTHPAFSERRSERARMVARQIQSEGVREPNVLASMRTVPRHYFVRSSDLRRAYGDHPLPIGLGQTISQPWVSGCGLRRDCSGGLYN